MGKIIAICISDEKGTQKYQVDTIKIVEGFGLENDAHGGDWHRQISFLPVEEINKFNEKGGGVSFGDFGENIVTEGIDFKKLKIGDKISLADCIVEITQFGKQCHSKCEIFERVGECIMPKLGVFAKVIKGGVIKKDDQITEL